MFNGVNRQQLRSQISALSNGDEIVVGQTCPQIDRICVMDSEMVSVLKNSIEDHFFLQSNNTSQKSRLKQPFIIGKYIHFASE